MADPHNWLGPYKTGEEALDALRRTIAEIIGADPEKWPDHGNAPLAIAAGFGLRAAELKARAPTQAARDVLAERRRQIEEKGWTHDHDDEHVLGEIAALAAFYAVPDGVRDWDFSSTGYGDTLAEALLPNGWTTKASEDRRRDLVKAGALILAEIERLDRAAAREPAR